MKRFRKIQKAVLACGSILLLHAGLLLAGQGEKSAPPSRIWVSKTTGKEYRVRIENDRFYAEWVHIPPPSAQHGAYIRTECRRVGSKWVGVSRSFLSCEVSEAKKGKISNWCHLTTRTEIHTVTPERITGRSESLHEFDCANCKVLETKMTDFVWVPKK